MIIGENELPLVLETAKGLKGTKTLVKHLGRLIDLCPDKNYFSDFLDPTGVQSWRIRMMMLEQCYQFFEVIEHGKMIDLVNKFSDDPTAVVRNGVVELWAKLIAVDSDALRSAKHLMFSPWQMRLLLVKIVRRIGRDVSLFWDVVNHLSKDPVSNVRFAVGEMLFEQGDKDLFNELFQNCTDRDIEELKDHLNRKEEA